MSWLFHVAFSKRHFRKEVTFLHLWCRNQYQSNLLSNTRRPGSRFKKKNAKVHESVSKSESRSPAPGRRWARWTRGTFHWDVSGREEKGEGWCVTTQLGSFLGWQTLPAELKADSHAEWRGACILFRHFATDTLITVFISRTCWYAVLCH